MPKLFSSLTPHQLAELAAFRKRPICTRKEALRVSAILLLEQKAEASLITVATAFAESTIYGLRQRYTKDGLSALADKRKPKALLNKVQLEQLTVVLNAPPSEALSNVTDEFWTISLLAHYIRDAFGVTYKSKTSYYLLFEQTRFSYHKPGQVYVKRNQTKSEAAAIELTNVLAEAWDDQDTIVLCEDEMFFVSRTTTQKVWLPKNHYPLTVVSNDKERQAVFGLLSVKTGRAFAYHLEKCNAEATLEVIQNIRSEYPAHKKLVIIWDNPKWHWAKVVTDYAKGNNITFAHFPPYDPEMNPVEHIWKETRSKFYHNLLIADIIKAADSLVTHIRETNFQYTILGFRAGLTLDECMDANAASLSELFGRG